MIEERSSCHKHVAWMKRGEIRVSYAQLIPHSATLHAGYVLEARTARAAFARKNTFDVWVLL